VPDKIIFMQPLHELAGDCRSLITSDWYRDVFPATRLAARRLQNAICVTGAKPQFAQRDGAYNRTRAVGSGASATRSQPGSAAGGKALRGNIVLLPTSGQHYWCATCCRAAQRRFAFHLGKIWERTPVAKFPLSSTESAGGMFCVGSNLTPATISH
jgi:hypothetical protein